eukprot:jgi/Psemu1/25220/gm1.25220_g
MSTITQLQAGEQPPIPFKPTILYQDYPKHSPCPLSTATPPLPPPPPNISGHTLKKQDTTFCPNATDKERLICIIEDFIDAVNTANLNIHDSVKHHHKARDILGGDLKHPWDIIVHNAGSAILDSCYSKNIHNFRAMFLPSNVFLVQQEYMLNATKPYHTDCFANAGYLWNQLNDANYPFQKLVTFMEQQRLHHDAGQHLCQNNNWRKYNGTYNNHNNNNRLPTSTFARPLATVRHAAPKQAHHNSAPPQEPSDNYFHNDGNQYNTPLTHEYNHNDGFYHNDEADWGLPPPDGTPARVAPNCLIGSPRVELGTDGMMARAQSTYEIQLTSHTFMELLDSCGILPEEEQAHHQEPPQSSEKRHTVNQYHHPRFSGGKAHQVTMDKQTVSNTGGHHHYGGPYRSCDLPGRFPVNFGGGHNYIYLMLDYDTSYDIMATPIKSREAEDLVEGFRIWYEELKNQGMVAQLVKVDNEISALMIEQFKKWHLDYQIVSPGDHRLNAAKWAIRTFKDNFFSILSGVDREYPADQWDLLVLQAVMTLNFLCSHDPKLPLIIKNQWGYLSLQSGEGRIRLQQDAIACKRIGYNEVLQELLVLHEDHSCSMDIIQMPHPPEPFLKHQSKITSALGIIKGILDPTAKLRWTKASKPKDKKRPSLSQTQNCMGGGGDHQEAIQRLQEARYLGGDEEEYTVKEVRKLLKRKQRLTKRNREELTKREALLPMKPKVVPLTNIPTPKGVLIVNLVALHLACSGSIWGEELNTWVPYRDLVKHPAAKEFSTTGEAGKVAPGTLLPTGLRRQIHIGLPIQGRLLGGEAVSSMDGYTEQALKEFECEHPKQVKKEPLRHLQPAKYRERIQYAPMEDQTALIGTEMKFIQKVVGKFLFYAHAIDNTMFHALNDIASAKDRKTTHKATMYFLNYAANHPNGSIVYRASEMILRADSDVVYLVSHGMRSRAGGYHYLRDKDGKMFNGPILVLAKIIKNVMVSAVKAEVASLFINVQETRPERQCLIELGHFQPPTPLKTHNMTAQWILTGTIKQKRAGQGQFIIFWEQGKHKNLAEWPTKHHPGNHHTTKVRPIYLYEPRMSHTTIQGGCFEISCLEVKKLSTMTPVAGQKPALPPGTGPNAGPRSQTTSKDGNINDMGKKAGNKDPTGNNHHTMYPSMIKKTAYSS